jgi:hypothetical protein
MSIIYPVFQKASSYLKIYARETFPPDAGQGSRPIIPGDDPGDQEPPEQRGLSSEPQAVATIVKLSKPSSPTL